VPCRRRDIYRGRLRRRCHDRSRVRSGERRPRVRLCVCESRDSNCVGHGHAFTPTGDGDADAGRSGWPSLSATSTTTTQSCRLTTCCAELSPSLNCPTAAATTTTLAKKEGEKRGKINLPAAPQKKLVHRSRLARTKRIFGTYLEHVLGPSSVSFEIHVDIPSNSLPAALALESAGGVSLG
jgi:hypothetical protein